MLPSFLIGGPYLAVFSCYANSTHRRRWVICQSVKVSKIMYERFIELVKNEPALVRNALFGAITIAVTHFGWEGSIDSWLQYVAIGGVYLVSGVLIRRNVTPTEKIRTSLDAVRRENGGQG